MKARQIVGKIIKRVHQVQLPQDMGRPRAKWCLDAIEFTDGSFLRFLVSEGDADYGVVGVYPAKEVR